MSETTITDSHASMMDRVYRRQRHIYDLTRKYYLFGRDTLLAGMNVPDGGRVLEVGCGTGRNLLAAAKRYEKALFYGFDISSEMLVSAKNNVSGSKVAERIFLAPGNAESFDACSQFQVAGFDRIFLSYTVSMIPGWQQAVRHSLTQLKPGGSLHVVDFGTMDAWPLAFRKLMQRWLARFHVEPRKDLEMELTRIAAETGLDVHVSRLGGGYAVIVSIVPCAQPVSQQSDRKEDCDWLTYAMQR